MSRARKFGRRAALGIGGLVIGLALVLALAFAWAQSESGRARVARVLESALSSPGTQDVTIERLEGRIPDRVTVVGLEVRDAEGTWLRARGLDLLWHPWDLLSGTLRIEALTLEQATIARPPVPPADEAQESSSTTVPSLPFEVVLDRLAIEELALNEAVLGVPAALRLEAQASIRDSNDLLASLRVERSDGTAGRIHGEVLYELAERRLTLDIAASEPPGGLIARALQLPDLPALEASAKGAGPLDGWQGTLDLDLADLAWAKAELALAGAGNLDFELSGQAGIETASDALPWTLLAPRSDFAAEGSWQDAGLLRLDRAAFKSDAGALELRGSLDSRSNRLEASLTGSLEEGRLIALLVEGARSGRLDFQAEFEGSTDAAEIGVRVTTDRLTVSNLAAREVALQGRAGGPLSQPELHAVLSAESLDSPEVSAEDLTAEIGFRPEAPIAEGLPGGSFQTTGKAARLRLPAAPALQALVGGDAGWSAAGRLDAQARTLDLERIEAAAGLASLTGMGNLGLEQETLSAELDLDLRDLAPLGRLLQIETQGSGALKARLTSSDLKTGLKAALSGKLRNLEVAEPFAQALLQDQVTLNAEVSLDPAGAAKVENIDVAAAHIALQGNLQLSDGIQSLAAEYSLAIPDVGVLGPPAGAELGGAARLSGSVEGSLADPRLAGRLELAEPRLDGRELENLALDFEAGDLAGEPRGKVTALAATPLGAVSGRTDFRLQQDLLRLEGIGLEAGDTKASGRAAVPLNGDPIEADIELAAPDLSPWFSLAGLQGKGAGEAQLKLFAGGTRQAASLEAKAQGLALAAEGGDPLSLKRLEVSLDGSDLLGDAKAKGRISARSVRLGELALDRVLVEASGSADGGEAQLDAEGTWIEPLALGATVKVSGSGEALSIEVARLQGESLGQKIRSQRPAKIEIEPGSLSLDGLDLKVGSASLQGSARQGRDSLAADIRLSNLPVSALQAFLSAPSASGRISGSLILSGSPKAPLGQLSLTVAELEAGQVEGGAPVNLSLTGDWRDGRLDLKGALEGLGSEQAAFSAALPLRSDPPGLNPRLPMREPLSGTLTWNGRIEEIWPLVPLDGHELGGQGALELELAGSLEKPLLTGRLALSDGSYENLETGTLLRELELLANLDGEKVEVSKLEAGDGGEGRLSATGSGLLDPGQDFPFALDGEFSTFSLARRDDLTASSDGKLSLEGSLRSAALQGQFKTRGVEIRIPDRLPPQVVDLEVTESGQELAFAPSNQTQEPEQKGLRLDLDLLVEMPDRVFVRGRGLDSEWAGRLEARGTAEEPDLKGTLNLVRGQMSLLGKDFKFQRGTLTFLGGTSVDPVLDIEALAETKDIKVTLGIAGRASSPEILLSSVPTLPQDEVVARLLFGKSTTQLSAIEAAQLAAAVAELTGADGGGPSVFDMVRGAIGVDVLRVETAGSGDSESSALSVGKYVTDGVYLGVTRGATAETGSMVVEFELTPNISLESKVGETGESNVGVKFKWDY